MSIKKTSIERGGGYFSHLSALPVDLAPCKNRLLDFIGPLPSVTLDKSIKLSVIVYLNWTNVNRKNEKYFWKITGNRYKADGCQEKYWYVFIPKIEK